LAGRVTDQAGDQGAEGHAKEHPGHEDHIQGLGREVRLQERRLHGGADVEVVAVEDAAPTAMKIM